MPASLLDVLSSFENIFSPLRETTTPPFTWTPGKPSIDIVIPACGDDLEYLPEVSPQKIAWGLYITIASCEKLLRDSGLDYRYFIVDNGNPVAGEFREAFDRTLEYVKSTGRAEIIYSAEALSPPSARNRGAAAGKGDLIFFFDNHCKVDSGYFAYSILTHERLNADAVHGRFRFPRWDTCAYHRVQTLKDNFWGMFAEFPLPDSLAQFHVSAASDLTWPVGQPLPYRAVLTGHGGFSVRRDTWEEVGGYWDEFLGFGGEESYFDLKLALLGKTNWINPNVSHWHKLDTKRPYKWTVESFPLYVENMLCAANIIGGHEWARTVANSQRDLKNHWLMQSKESKARLKEREAALGTDMDHEKRFDRALQRSDERARWLAGRRLRTLDEVLVNSGGLAI